MTKEASIFALLASPIACEASFAAVTESLRRLPSAECLHKCRQLHALILTSAPSSSLRFLFNNLISVYSKCGGLVDAQKLFDRLPERTIVSYNAIITAYSKYPRQAASSMHIFRNMTASGVIPNASTFAALAHVLRGSQTGSAVHCRIVVLGFYGNLFVQTSLLRMYLGCRSFQAAEKVFHEMDGKDEVACNSILLSRLDRCGIEHGLQLFFSMVEEGLDPTPCTFTMLLSACRKSGNSNAGRLVHVQIIKSKNSPDNPLLNALIDMYASFGDARTANLVFERMDAPDLVTWNSLIAGFSNNNDGEKAMEAFCRIKDEFPLRKSLPR
ncbi:Pentatricopeptide repeat-containing protein [Platanthera guangdongensis]|uniref:Pentatricopeptide repeat-containing protein n=1 Tax=Platanthera guangdongensis TaxID=2320717 RepID=A0ABR2LWU4_9ASPA